MDTTTTDYWFVERVQKRLVKQGFKMTMKDGFFMVWRREPVDDRPVPEPDDFEGPVTGYRTLEQVDTFLDGYEACQRDLYGDFPRREASGRAESLEEFVGSLSSEELAAVVRALSPAARQALTNQVA